MERSGRRDLLAFAGLAVGLLAWFAGPGIVRGFVFPVGPDAPVYLWWTRLVGVEGLSSVTRPGVPALALVLAGTLRASVSPVLAALEIVGGVLTGVGGAAVMRIARPDDRVTWVLGGVLLGTFAVHVATGYLATLAFGVIFLVAVASLAAGGRRGAVVAATLLGAGGIAHPRFLAFGGAILLLAAVFARRADPSEARRIAGAIVGGAVILAVAGLALLLGPSPLLVDTSRDGFLRRVGLHEMLRRSYMSRFIDRWTRYAPWGVVPAVCIAAPRPRTPVERVLVSWIAVAAIGASFSALTRLLPVDRFLTFAYAVPLVAAVGITRLARTGSGPRVTTRLAALALAGAMLVGAWTSWMKQEPYADVRDLRALQAANAATLSAADSALVFPVGPAWNAFVPTLFGNLVRATVPPDRIRDVVIVNAGGALGTEAEAIREQTAEDVRLEIADHGGRAQVFFVAPFSRTQEDAEPATVGPDLSVDPPIGGPVDADDAVDPVVPFAPWLPALLALPMIAIFCGIGWWWARIAGFDVAPPIAAIAPGAGMGVMILVAVLLERLGLPLSGSIGPITVSATSIAAGWLAHRAGTRRARVPAERQAEP